MGATQSTADERLALAKRIGTTAAPLASAAYERAMVYAQRQGYALPNVSGGGGAGAAPAPSYFGGAKELDPMVELRDYEQSLAAAAKEKVVRAVARAMKNAGIDVNAEEPDLETLARRLAEKIPDPKKKMTFKVEAATHSKLCRLIAKVLNDQFSPGAVKAGDQFIDTTISDESICRAVAEWVQSFTKGIHVEFMGVHAAVNNTIRTLEVLRELLDTWYREIADRIEKDGDSKLASSVGPFDEVYRRTSSEIKKQLDELKNMLNVTLAPASKMLELALRDDSETAQVLKRIGMRPGTPEFGDSISNVLLGLGTAAATAAKVDKALRTVGVSVRDYLASPNFKALESQLDEKLLAGKLKKEEFAKFVEAVNTLRKTFGQRAVIKASLESAAAPAATTGGATPSSDGGATTGGDCGCGGGSADTKHSHAHGGGDDDGGDDKTVDRRVKKIQAQKWLILMDFAKKISRSYEDILRAIKSLAPMLGKQIILSDKTAALRDALERMQTLRAGSSIKTEQALIGAAATTEAREHKERFQSSLRLVASAIADMQSVDAYRPAAGALSSLKAAIDGLNKVIDTYSDMFKTTYGGGASGGADDAMDADERTAAIFGGAGADEYRAELSRSTLSLKTAVDLFTYNYFVAGVRQNLDQTAKEVEVYGEKYADLLGEAVGNRLSALDIERKNRLDFVKTQLTSEKGAAGGVAAREKEAEEKAAALTEFISREYSAKNKLYNALQAIDLYMKAFTNAITKDPDAVREIKKILDGTQVISRWFSDNTGEALWKAFDSMGTYTRLPGAGGAAFVHPAPAGAGAAVASMSTALRTAPPVRSTHYYAKLVSPVVGVIGPAAPVVVGRPLVGVHVAAKEAKDVVNNVATACDEFQALKNLVNAFSRIGDVFGGQELRTKVFMSPTQIFKALLDYLKASALSVHTGSGGLPGPINFGTAARAEVGNGQIFFPVVDDLAMGIADVAAKGSYVVEDHYFVLAIKAMTAKILTVIGVFDMFERKTPLTELTPTRIIIGGGPDDVPEIIDAAVELYFRLPPLVEFYRSFLRWNPETAGPGPSMKIAMLPDIEGIFSGLIRIIFQKPGYVNSADEVADYTDSETRAIIREVNSIYAHFKAKASDRVTDEAITALIREVNRRFGIVTADEMKKYWNMIGQDRKSQIGEINPTGFSILPGEDEDEGDMGRRAPSDRYRRPAEGRDPTKALAGERMLDTFDAANSHRAMVREFRDLLMKNLDRPEVKDSYGKISFRGLITQASADLARASSKDAKMNVVMKLIQGTHSTGADAGKSFMFHETVVLGLNTLQAIQKLISNFQETIAGLDPEAIVKEFKEVANAAGGAPALNARAAALISAALPTTVANRRNTHIYLPGTNIASRVSAGGTAIANVYAAFSAVYYNGAASEADKNKALKLWGRFAINWSEFKGETPSVMQEFLEAVFDFVGGSRGLVDARIGNAPEVPLQLDFSKLQNFAEGVFADVKAFLDMMRPHFPSKVIDRYEKLTNNGSVYQLERDLFTKHFRGIDETESSRELTLNGIASRVNRIYSYLTADTQVYSGLIAGINGAGGGVAPIAALNAGVPAANANDVFESYGSAVSLITHYDGIYANSGVPGRPQVPRYEAGSSQILGPLIETARRTAAGGTTVPQVQTPAGAGAGNMENRIEVFEEKEGFTPYRSLLFAYNQLVAKYVQRLADPAGGVKIYAGLLTAFVNGPASQAVASPATGTAYPDLSRDIENFGRRGDPKPGATLFESLAYVLARLTRDIDERTRLSDHLVTTLVEVPLYVKEAMRANLPSFIRLFEVLIAKCDFIKQLTQKTKINLARASQGRTDQVSCQTRAGAAVVLPGVGVANFSRGASDALLPMENAVVSSGEMRGRLVGIVDSISAGSYALSQSAQEVLRELRDVPTFLQTQENSIEVYKSRYGKMPLMPLSLALHSLVNLTEVNRTGTVAAGNLVPAHKKTAVFMPDQVLGTSAFKFLYGTRGLLVGRDAISFEAMPGVKHAVEQYNMAAPAKDRIDAGRYLAFAQRVVGLLRWATETRHFRGQLSTVDLPTTNALDIPKATGNNASAYTIGREVAEVAEIVEIVESSDQDGSANKLAGAVGAQTSPSGGSREVERILNVVDLGKIPINVHALMRTIPMVNLFNYSYTFDEMCTAVYSGMAARDLRDKAVAQVSSTREMFLKLLIDPFLTVDEARYGSDTQDLGTSGFVHRIFRGDNALGMGRPKFLSDQLFNKALFGSIYPSKADFDEAGPGVGAGIQRGRGGVGFGRENKGAIAAVQKAERDLAAMAPAIATLNTALAGIPRNITIARRAEDAKLETVIAAYKVAPGPGTRAAVIAQINTMTPMIDQSNIATKFVLDNDASLTALDADIKAAIAMTPAGVAAETAALQTAVADLVLLSAYGASVAGTIGALQTHYDQKTFDYSNGFFEGHSAVTIADSTVVPGGVLAVRNTNGRVLNLLKSWAGLTAALLNLKKALKNEDRSTAAPYPPNDQVWSANNSGALTYLNQANQATPDAAVVEVRVNGKATLMQVGKERFDTRFVRKLFFIANVNRLLRLKLSRELTQSHAVLRTSHLAVAPGLTEYGFENLDPNEHVGDQKFENDDS